MLAESDAFDLDCVDYLKFSQAECYLREEFEQSFKYELRGLLFVPQNQVKTDSQLLSSLPFLMWIVI